MTPIPHYVQAGNDPAVTGEGTGAFACACGRSTLIAAYDPLHFLCIAIRCAACGTVSETPGMPAGLLPAFPVVVIERGAEQPPAFMPSGNILISREELERVTALYLPRDTAHDSHVIGMALLDEVEAIQERWTNAPLDPAPRSHKDQALAWAVAHYRARLREPDWTSFATNADLVAMTAIAAFRDLFASWGHHPLFPAMMGTAMAGDFSLHALAIFGTAKLMTLAGNPIGFTTATGARPKVHALYSGLAGPDQVSIAVNRFDRFEWPDGAVMTPPAVQAAVVEAMASVQGSINRLRPGILVLSGGAAEGPFDQMLVDGLAGAIASHGKRHRGLAAVAGVLPKLWFSGRPGEARFGYNFYPMANRHHSMGGRVRMGGKG